MWKIKYRSFIVKIKTEIVFVSYKLKNIIGFKTVGYGSNEALILFKLLKKHQLPIFSMSITKVNKPIESYNLDELHESGLRTNKNDRMSIIFNPKQKQVKIFIGSSLTPYISNKNKIEEEMQKEMNKNHILKAMENGMMKINKTVSSNL